MSRNIFVGTDDNVVKINSTNIDKYFTVSNSSQYFSGSGNVFTNTNTNTVGTAQTTLTAKIALNSLSFDYSYSTSSTNNTFTITVAGTTILNSVTGTGSSTYTTSLNAGDTVVFRCDHGFFAGIKRDPS